jgi:hypothetical protein
VNEQRVVVMLPDTHGFDQALAMMALGKNRTGAWLGNIVDLDRAMPFDAHALDKREAGTRDHQARRVVDDHGLLHDVEMNDANAFQAALIVANLDPAPRRSYGRRPLGASQSRGSADAP